MLPREPSGPIQVTPSGLLGFFNLKNSGRNPGVLLDSVGPSIEMRDWYFASQLDSLTDTVSVTAAQATFAFVNLVVPPTEAWWVESATLIADVTVAQTLNLALAKLVSPPSGRVVIISPNQGYTTPAGGARIAIGGKCGFFLAPGSGFACVGLQWAAGPMTATCNVEIARLNL